MTNIEWQLNSFPEHVLNKVSIEFTCYFPFSDVCANALLFSNKSRFLNNKNEFNLTREFYRIIKTSYCLGLERILILEDDFVFMQPHIAEEFLKEMPEDFDIIQLSYLFNDKQYDYVDIINEYKKGSKFIKKTFGAFSNNGLCLSRNGMKWWLERIESEFTAADIPAHESKNNMHFFGKTNLANKEINHYIPTIPVIYVDGMNSSVQTEDKYELYKFYTLLDKNIYNIKNVN